MERLLGDAEKLTGVKYDMNNLGDVYEAIHVIQEDLGLTGVAAQEAATTFSGSFGAMKASAANFLADLTTGGDIQASMTQLITSVGTFVSGNLLPMLWNIATALPGALSTALSIGAQTVMTEGPKLISSLITGIQTNVPLLIERGNALALSIRDGIMQNAPAMYEQAKQLITDYASKIAEAAPQLLEKGKDLLISLGNGILENIPVLSENIVNVIDSVSGFIMENLPTLATTVAGILEKLGATIVNKIPVVAGAILRGAPVVLRAVTNIGMSMLRNLTALIPQVARAGLTIIAGLARGIGGSAVGLVRAAMNRIKQAMEKPIQEAKETLSGIIEKIKGLFPLNIGRIADISLPHISVSGGTPPYGILGKGSPPEFSVKWWAEGGIMTKPVLFGGGEAGHEGIIPLDPFWKKMDKIAEATRGGTVINVTVNGAESPELWATRFAREYKQQVRTV